MQSPVLFGSIGGDLGQMAQDTAVRFGVDLPHFIAQCVSFGIVAFLLHRYAYKPILTVLAERKRRIQESLENAEKVKRDLANAQAKTHEMLVQAGQESARMIEEARAAAAKVQEQETQKAIASAQAIVDKARQATEAEHARMLAELRREIGRLVVATTGKVTGKVLTLDDQKRLAEETNRELAA
ncbi:MAG TPA: F0F1 ATP synthase subunit B [Candidatus Paceibacterota bacterium]|nr:F0F1 ATP synthase subunit B [Verrucomicrobiota bacterium]HSA12947.1 F0F1 ATP synthase subunit B [Candidatus Paceibacterota bacterium]